MPNHHISSNDHHLSNTPRCPYVQSVQRYPLANHEFPSNSNHDFPVESVESHEVGPGPTSPSALNPWPPAYQPASLRQNAWPLREVFQRWPRHGDGWRSQESLENYGKSRATCENWENLFKIWKRIYRITNITRTRGYFHSKIWEKSSNQFDRSCGYKNWDNIWDTAIWDVTNQQWNIAIVWKSLSKMGYFNRKILRQNSRESSIAIFY